MGVLLRQVEFLGKTGGCFPDKHELIGMVYHLISHRIHVWYIC